jgi:hypothetical protein
MAKILGKVTLKIDGADIKSYPGATLDIGGTVRNPRVGHKYHGYSEQDKQAECECRIDLTESVSLDTIRGWADVTLAFETDVGKSYVINNASLANPPRLTDGGDSSVELSFFGPPAEEVGG